MRSGGREEFEVKAYWTRIETKSPLRMEQVYAVVIKQPTRDSYHASRIGALLADTGKLEAASRVRACLLEHYREHGDRARLQGALGAQALILYARGDLDGAMALHQEQEQLCRELHNNNGLQVTLGNQALILFTRGDLDGATALHQEEERLCRELGDKKGLARALSNRALILYARGDLDGAMALHKEAELHLPRTRQPAGACGLAGQPGVDPQDPRGPGRRHGPAQGSRSASAANSATRMGCQLARATRRISSTPAETWMAPWPCTRKKSASAANSATRMGCKLARQPGDDPQLRGDLDGAMALHKEAERLCRELGNKR